MGSAAMQISVEQSKALQGFVHKLELLGREPEEILGPIGQFFVGETKRVFQHRGAYPYDHPDAERWPDKPPHWAYWEGGRNVPLTYRGRLMNSITHDLQGTTLRVGSALRYAATHQFGDDEQRTFNIWLEPEYEPGAHGKMRIARFENGLPKGKLVVGPSAGQQVQRFLQLKEQGASTAEARSRTARFERKRKGEKEPVRLLKVRIRQRVTARPFLRGPSPSQWHEITELASKVIFRGLGSQAVK